MITHKYPRDIGLSHRGTLAPIPAVKASQALTAGFRQVGKKSPVTSRVIIYIHL